MEITREEWWGLIIAIHFAFPRRAVGMKDRLALKDTLDRTFKVSETTEGSNQ